MEINAGQVRCHSGGRSSNQITGFIILSLRRDLDVTNQVYIPSVSLIV